MPRQRWIHSFRVSGAAQDAPTRVAKRILWIQQPEHPCQVCWPRLCHESELGGNRVECAWRYRHSLYKLSSIGSTEQTGVRANAKWHRSTFRKCINRKDTRLKKRTRHGVSDLDETWPNRLPQRGGSDGDKVSQLCRRLLELGIHVCASGLPD